MQSTHQSIIQSVVSSFRIASKLAGENNQNLAQKYLSNTKLFIMHHNKYELGPDVFNEGYYILEKVLKILRENKNENLIQFLNDKSTQEYKKRDFPLGRNDKFIYDDLLDLIKYSKIIWGSNDKDFIDNLINYIDNVMKESLQEIGERIEINYLTEIDKNNYHNIAS